MAVKLTWCYTLNYRTTWSILLPTSLPLPCSCSFFCGGWEKKKRTTTQKKNPNWKVISELTGLTHFPVSPGKGHHCSAVTFDQKSKGWVLEKEKTVPHKAFPHSEQGLTELSGVCSKCTEYFFSLTCFYKHAMMYIRKQHFTACTGSQGMSHAWQMLN